MNKDTAIYVGLDVHKESVAVSVAEAGWSTARILNNLPTAGWSRVPKKCVKWVVLATVSSDAGFGASLPTSRR